MKKKITAYGLGRTRSRNGKGNIIDYHLNPYTMCIHTLCGSGWETMMVLVVEVYEETEDKDSEQS